MSDYKRFTETLNCYINGNPCKPYGHCLANCTEQKSITNNKTLAKSCGDCEHFGKVLTRLAELEDKIENGELVENNSVTFMAMARTSGKTLVDKALKYDNLKSKIEQGLMLELPCIRKCETCYQVVYEDKETKQVGYISYGLGQLDKAKVRLKELKGEV